MRALFAWWLLAASTLALGADPFAAGNQPQFLPVEEAYQLDVSVAGQGDLRLHWQIAEGYYLYQHRFAVQLEDGAGPVPVAIDFPPALERTDEYFGEVRVYYDEADLLAHPERVPERAALTVTSQGCADAGLCYPPEKAFFSVDFASGRVEPAPPPARPVPATAGTQTGGGTLLYMLGLAFLGGAILNLMPCVFPILSLKVLGFTRASAHDRHLHSWVYAAGVVASFLLVAVLLIVLQQAGRAIGWGFQLQSPGFVIALAYLFIAMGLSLSGVVQFGGSVMNLGSGLADRGGASGSFFTGVLAVVVASPCTAPFMGTALGFAITQPAAVSLLVFAALGAGMAAPMLLLSYSGMARRLLPRPGPWMETMKQLLAFPLYGTAIWLLWVAGRQLGVNTMAVALAGALLLALGLWLWQFGSWRRGLALVCVLGALGFGAWHPPDAGIGRRDLAAQDRVAWSEQALDEIRRAGNPVFVDVTADWCLTCKANEAAVLNSDAIDAAFAAHGIVYMVADWTNYDPGIAAFLQQHRRNGIPLYLLYPADPAREPLILPQLLTRSTVLEAIGEVAGANPGLAAQSGADSSKDRLLREASTQPAPTPTRPM